MQNDKLKNAVRYFYDLQQLRMQSQGRSDKKSKVAEAHLDEDDKDFLKRQSKKLNDIEKDALKEVGRLLKGIPIYEHYLKDTRGIGPTLAGVLISEINIEKCNTVSQLWAWCGLSNERYCADCHTIVPEKPHEENKCPNCSGTKHYHKAIKPRRGEKLKYNPWLKSKMLKVMGDCLMRTCSLDENGYYNTRWVEKPTGEYPVIKEKHKDDNGKLKSRPYCERIPYNGTPFRKTFDDYKKYKENNILKICMGCNGSGKVTRVERDKVVDIGTKKPRTKSKCPNCDGTGGPAPWGASAMHRKNAANRYMVKQFLLQLWVFWRELEGLEVRDPYAVEYLGKSEARSG